MITEAAPKLTPSAVLRLGAATGLIAALIPVYAGIIGLLVMMNARPVIAETLTLAQAILLLTPIGAGLWLGRRLAGTPGSARFAALVAGLVAGLTVYGFASLIVSVNLRHIFIALTLPLARLLTFKLGGLEGFALYLTVAAALALAGALLAALPGRAKRALAVGGLTVLLFGMFQELLQVVLTSNRLFASIGSWLYSHHGLMPRGATTMFMLGIGLDALAAARRERRLAGASEPSRLGRHLPAAALALGLLLLPLLGGPYVAQVFLLVGLYVLMGMGLNLELGLAGLLDLGFVAFFATGAYVTALLTADSPMALAAYTSLPSFSFWAAVPFAVLAAVIVGLIFGTPVLGVKGDYLALATLGLGEIVRIVALSDAAAPLLGGPQGILQVPKPMLGSFEFSNSVALFYLTLAAATFAGYCAWRLERSRLGRAWIALREDEDVAQALGINLVTCKLLAYAMGAAFAGLAGAIFAAMVNSVFPSSFQLLMSINVLALIIVGGLGSLPGVALGALVLIGLPEALREFGEYRYLFYGFALILTMRLMPEGLIPSARWRLAADLREGQSKPAAGADA